MAAKARPLFPWAASALGVALIFAGCSASITAPPEPPAAVRRGDDAFRYQDYEAAIASYRSYLDRGDRGLYTPRTFYMTALAQYRLSHHEDALNTLDELAHRYPKGRWVQVEALRGDIQRAMGHPALALQAWDAGWTFATDAERAALRQRIVTTARLLNDSEIAHVQRVVTSKEVRQLLDQQIASRQTPAIDQPLPGQDEPPGVSDENPAERAGSNGVMPAPRPDNSAPVPSNPALPLAAPAAAPPDTADDLVVSGNTNEPVLANPQVGCLLPLSGSARDLGERSLRGLRLGLGDGSAQLVVRDTGDDPTAAARMFDELAQDPNVVAVVGPLQSDVAHMVSGRAEAAHVPVLLLTEDDASAGRFALATGVNHSREVGALLDYAMRTVRLRRFGVLYPKDQEELFDTFRTEVTRRGGTVVGSDSYPRTATDLAPDVQAVKQWRDAQNLQAVFLPDSTMPAPAFARSVQDAMPDITLLGMHGWEDVAGRDGALDGLLFADTFYGGSARGSTRAFVDAFQQAYGQMPGVAEAQAYDAGLLVQRTLASGVHSRADFLDRLHGLGPIDGATGELHVSDRGVQHNLFLLQFSQGQLQEIGATVAR